MPVPSTLPFPAAHQFDCQIADENQCALTERWLRPEMEGIAADLLLIRRKVDAHFARLQSREHTQQPSHLSSFYHIQAYPYGYCERIRNMVWDTIQHQFQHPARATPHIGILKQFSAAGGLMRKIWGELTHGPYLQNAIQLGAYYVDAANDTVDITKPKLEIKLLGDTTFRNIVSFEQYFDIVDTYYQWDTYPNLYFPDLAPLYPGIAIHRTAGMLLLCDIPLPLMYKNLQSCGALAHRFLFDSCYATKDLSAQHQRLLREFQQHFHLRAQNSHERAIAAIEQQYRQLQQWLQQQTRAADVEARIVALDTTRKKLDHALRRFSLPAEV